MSHDPELRMAYATVVPSGESAGFVSTPAASVIGVKRAQRSSACGARASWNAIAAAATTATAAIAHGTAARELRGAGRFTEGAAPLLLSELVSSAKARSSAD